MNKVSYVEAGELLDKPLSTVNRAVGRAVFTRIPVTGQTQYLIREQVELFKGKSQLSLRSLNREERKLWEQYRDEVVNPHQVSPSSDTSQKMPVMIIGLTQEQIDNLTKASTGLVLTGLF